MFVDAAFAFSITMPALSPDRVPSSFDALMHAHAYRRRVALGLTPHEAHVTRCEIIGALLHSAVGVLSMALAIVFARSMWVIASGFAYGLLGVVIPLYWARFGPTGEARREARGGAEPGV